MANKHWQLQELTSVFADNLMGSVDLHDSVQEYKQLFAQTLPPKTSKQLTKLRIKRITLLSLLAVQICHDVNINALIDADDVLKILRERFRTCSLSTNGYILPIPTAIYQTINKNSEALALIDAINKTSGLISKIHQYPKYRYLSLEEALNVVADRIYKKQIIDKGKRQDVADNFINEYKTYFGLDVAPTWIKETALNDYIQNIEKVQHVASQQQSVTEHGSFWLFLQKTNGSAAYPPLMNSRKILNDKSTSKK